MDDGILRKIIKAVIALVIVGLLAGMAFIIIRYRSDMNERSRRLAELSPEAAAYEAELTDLLREQENEEMSIYMPEGPGVAVISFLVDGVETFNAAREYGEAYGFTPTILLKTDEWDPDPIIEVISGSGLDVILYSRGEYSAENIKRIKDSLRDAGLGDTGACLIRASDDTEKNRKTLKDSGIETLFLYGDTLTSGTTDDGTVELNYSYVNRTEYTPTNRLASLADTEQGLLFAFDLVETTVTERQTEEILELIKDQADSGHIAIGSVADAVRTVKDRVAREKEKLDAFNEAKEARSARIAELKEKIAEIYSHWDDTSKAHSAS